MVIPQALYRQWFPETTVTRAKQLQRLREGAAYPVNPAIIETIQKASLRSSTREFADLTMPQIRALVGVFAMLTDAGETNGLFAESRTIDATEFYRLAEVPSRQTKLTRSLLAGVVDLADRRVFLEARGKGPDGKAWVAMIEKPPFEVVPIFAEDDRADLLEQWAEWRQYRREAGRAAPWSGPMPERYLFTIPHIVRQSAAPLIFSRDVLACLERGAKAVRGRGGKVVPRDWALWLEIVRTRQPRQLSFLATDGLPITSFNHYVDRWAFLRDYSGSRATRNRAQLDTEYLTSVDVLLKSELVLEVKLNVATKKSPTKRRDIFTPNPQKLLGVQKRAEGMVKALARGGKGRKKATRRERDVQ